MHDDMQMIRQLEFEKCLKDGQIPCRWTPDLGYGYGYPLFNFYPPMPYIVGQVFRTFNISFVDSVKLTAAVQFVLAAFFMYLLAKSLFGELGGLLSALFYTYAPYHAVDVYVRGAMNESWALVFFPLIFYFTRQLIIKSKLKYLIGFSISLTGVFLSHNPMVLTLIPFLGVWVLVNLLIERKFSLSIILKLFLASIFSLCLNAFFTLPLLLESSLTHIDTMFTGYYHYSIHFTTIKQLFISNFWGDGPSVWGPEDGMSFAVGYLHWIIPVILSIYSLVLLIKNKKLDKQLILSLTLTFLGFFAIFMTHNKSTFIWQLFPAIQKIQFPWRFLNHVIFLLSLSVGVLPIVLKKHIKQKFHLLVIIIVFIPLFILNISHYTPITHGPVTDEQKFSGLAWTNQITSGIYDYLPLTADIAAKGPAKPFIDEVKPHSTYKLSGEKQGSDWMSYNLSLNQDSQVILSELAFPNFLITDNNQKIDYSIEKSLGRIVINLKSGDHRIFVKFVNTPIRTVSNYISLLSWLAVLLYFVKQIWNRSISKKSK
jgi:hypothetical protein